MNGVAKTQIYKDEFKFILGGRGSGVRRVVVISAFIEGQILSLAKKYLKEHGVKYKPKPGQEYHQSLNILEVNGELSPDELKEIRDFRPERNKAIHNIFKGFNRKEWERQNKQVIDLGRPIVEKLDKKLFP